MKQLCGILCILFLFTSCDKNKEFKDLLTQIQEKEIILPIDSMACIGNVEQQIHFPYKIVVYTDSTECSSCLISSLDQWNPLLDKLENYGGKVGLYFIFNPAHKDMDAVKYSVKAMNASGLLYMDTLDLFLHRNAFIPKDAAMHTFLLDDNNKILLVGNPLYNKEIENLLWKVLDKRIKDK